MLNRLLVLAGSLVAAASVAALPAVIGLSGNPSFSHQLPVHVPSQARAVRLVDGASAVSVAPARTPSPSRIEAGDDGPSGTPASTERSRGGAGDVTDDSGGADRSGDAGPTTVRSSDGRDDGLTVVASTGSDGHPASLPTSSGSGDDSRHGGSGSGGSTTSSLPHETPSGGSTSDSRHGGDGTGHN